MSTLLGFPQSATDWHQQNWNIDWVQVENLDTGWFVDSFGCWIVCKDPLTRPQVAAVYTGHHVDEARSKLERADNLNLASTVCSRWGRTYNLEVFVSDLSAGTSQIRIKRQFKIWINWREEGNKTIIGNDNDSPHILKESESDYHPNNESESKTKELALLLMI